MSTIILKPAYGRTYESLREVLGDWNAGKDFILKTGNSNASDKGTYCSNRDLVAIRRDFNPDKIWFAWHTKGGKAFKTLYWESLTSKIIPTTYI